MAADTTIAPENEEKPPIDGDVPAVVAAPKSDPEFENKSTPDDEEDEGVASKVADSTAEVLEKTDAYLGMPLFAAELVGPLVAGGVASAAGFVGLQSLQNGANKVKYATSQATLGEIGDKLKVSKPVSGVVQKLFDFASKPIAWVSDFTGLGARRVLRHTEKGHVALMHAQNLVENASLHEGSLPAELHGEINALKSELSSAKNIKNISGEALGKTLSDFSSAVEKCAANNKEWKPHADVEALIAKTHGVVEHRLKMDGWSDIGKTIREKPQNLGSTRALSGVMHTAWVAGSAGSMIRDVRGLQKNSSGLAQAYKDLTGEEASWWKMLTGPKVIRNEYLRSLKSFFVSEGSDTAAMAFNVSMLRNIGKSHGGGFMNSAMGGFALMAAQYISAGYNSILGESYVPLYKALKDVEKRGEPLPVEAVAQLIRMLNEDLAAKPEQFSLALADDYIRKNVSVGVMFKKAETGELIADMYRLIEAQEKKKAGTQQSIKPEIVEEHEAKPSHVEKLHGAKRELLSRHKAPKEVVGPHSAGVVEATNSARDQGAALGAA